MLLFGANIFIFTFYMTSVFCVFNFVTNSYTYGIKKDLEGFQSLKVLLCRRCNIKRLVCRKFRCQMRSGRKCIQNCGNTVRPLADLVAADRSSQLAGLVMRFLWVRTKSNQKIMNKKAVCLVVWTRNDTASSLQAVSSIGIATKTHFKSRHWSELQIETTDRQTDVPVQMIYHCNIKSVISCSSLGLCCFYITKQAITV